MNLLKLWKAGFIFVAALFLAAATVFSQSLPLEDKARYEKALEQKVDEMLLKLLGPNQAKVSVQASMDFSRTEKVDVTSGGGETGAKGLFKWQSATADSAGQPLNDYLLPGFPSLGAGESENKSYQKQLIFPSSFIKRLTVTVVLNKTMSETEAQNVRAVVSEVLGLDQARGDALSIIRTPFAPVWRTIWYSPESVSLLFKYGILSIIGIVSMIVVAIGFLKLAAAMNTMAKAQQSHQITMDLGKGMGGMGGGGALPGLDKLELGGEKKEAAGKSEAAAGEPLLFNVRPDQVDFLVTLMSGEDPSNVALVAGHLPEDVKSGFLRKLPAEVSAEVISNMAQMRFVEPDVISTIREELERRLAGAFGGVEKVLAAISGVSLKAKKNMLESLQRRHPELAGEVRPRVFLQEDLMKFSDRDFSILATSVKLEDWALALNDLTPEFRDRLKGQLPEKTWAMLEQTMKYGAPSAEKAEKAVEDVVSAALKMMREGRIANPLEAQQEAPAGSAVAVKGGAV